MRNRIAAVLLVALLGVMGCGDDEPAPSAIPPWAKVAPEQLAEAKKHGVPVAFENDLGMRFVLIPAGTFLMGSPEEEEGRDDDETQHEVTIARPFYLATTETTQAAWERVMGGNPATMRGAALPVTHVLWDDCQAFVKRLNETAPSGYRLPTEAEWEYACRAGTMTRFWAGDADEDLDRVGWCFRNSGNQRLPEGTAWRMGNVLGEWACRAHAVGEKPANPWGLHDMHGNVWEWCEDYWHDSYEGAPDDGSARLDLGPRWHYDHGWRVKRGGSWFYAAKHARSAGRSGAPPGSLNYGFRLVRTVTPEEPPASAPVASPQVPVAVPPQPSPQDVVLLWLDAAKRGDAEAMAALWAEEKRAPVKTAPKMRRAEVASGKLRAALWRLGGVGQRREEHTVTVHVRWAHSLHYGDNLEFHFVQRDGRWWIVGIWDYD